LHRRLCVQLAESFALAPLPLPPAPACILATQIAALLTDAFALFVTPAVISLTALPLRATTRCFQQAAGEKRCHHGCVPFATLPNPSPAIVHPSTPPPRGSKTALNGFISKPRPTHRATCARPLLGPLWPCHLRSVTDRLLFGDRDKTIHDNVEEILQGAP
jgi:hypothetical protein